MLPEPSLDNSSEYIEVVLTPDEEQFLQLLEGMEEDIIFVNRTQNGILPGAIDVIKRYYSDMESYHILQSLVRKGLLKREDNGILLLCPRCNSHKTSVLLTCPSCGSIKLRLRRKIVHTTCEIWGTFEEFSGGNTICCPVCTEEIETEKILDNDKGFSYSDPYYECQECKVKTTNALNLNLCRNCNNTYSNLHAIQLEQTGFKVIVEPNPEQKFSENTPTSSIYSKHDVEEIIEEAPLEVEEIIEEAPLEVEEIIEEAPLEQAPLEVEEIIEEAPLEQAPLEVEEIIEEAPLEQAPLEVEEIIEEAPLEQAPLEEEEIIEEAPLEQAPLEEEEIIEEAPLEQAPLEEEEIIEEILEGTQKKVKIDNQISTSEFKNETYSKPITLVETEPKTRAIYTHVNSPLVNDRVRILIVEDDVLTNESLKYLIESIVEQDCEINSLYDGEKVIEEIMNNSYDLVLLDNKLPYKSGLDILKELKDRQNKTSVIFLTGFSNEETAVQAMKLGAKDYISKGTTNVERLRDAINEIMLDSSNMEKPSILESENDFEGEEAPLEVAPLEVEEIIEEAPLEEAPLEVEEIIEEAPLEQAPLEVEEIIEEAPLEQAPLEQAPLEEEEIIEEAPLEQAPLEVEEIIEKELIENEIEKRENDSLNILFIVENNMVYNYILEGLQETKVKIELFLVEGGAFSSKAHHTVLYDLIILDTELKNVDFTHVINDMIKWKIISPLIIIDDGSLGRLPGELNVIEVMKRKQRDLRNIKKIILKHF